MTLVDHHFYSSLSIASVFGILLASITLYAIGIIIYNLFFHPLRHIPGPWLAGATPIPFGAHTYTGNINDWIRHLHTKYGDAVRVAPSEVSFTSGETAWPDIYGFRTGKYKHTGAYLKDNDSYPSSPSGVWSIVNANEGHHTRIRRNLAHAFSDKALRSQESLVMTHVDTLLEKLSEQAEENKSVDIMRWYNFATFDIITDLSFGEPLGCLNDSQCRDWVSAVFSLLKGGPFLTIRNKYIVFRWIEKLRNILTLSPPAEHPAQWLFTRAKGRVESRLAEDSNRPDFFSFILQNQEKDNRAISRDEMDINALFFLVAGSETTATSLSGTTYLLLKNKAAYNRLVSEIRSTFSSAKEITIETASSLPYLIAALQEGLRYYPPVPTGLPRTVPGTEQQISGYYIPGGTSVYMSQHAANHSAVNFANADGYVPERWLESERPAQYDDDKRMVVQPFSHGPRNCLGKNLANAELRLIIAKLLWTFDLELVSPEEDWLNQRVFQLWEKPGLSVKLSAIKR